MAQNKAAAGLKAVLVCGSDGVGSIAAMVSAILTASGRRCGLLGLYRAEIDGAPLAPEEREAAAALRAFEREKCAFAVLECRGQGERAAALAEDPVCVIIAHTQRDDTARCLAQIRENGCVCAYMPDDDEQLSAIAAACREKGAALRVSDPDELETLRDGPDGQTVCYCDDTPYTLSVAGDTQACNAAVVLEAVEMLREHGVRIKDEAVAAGLAAVRMPGCFELMPGGARFILDTPRTRAQAMAMRANFDFYYDSLRRAAIISALRGPDTAEMAACAAFGCCAAVCLTAPEEDAVPAEALARMAQDVGCTAVICGTTDKAIAAALAAAGRDGAVCCMVTPETGREVRANFIREDT